MKMRIYSASLHSGLIPPRGDGTTEIQNKVYNTYNMLYLSRLIYIIHILCTLLYTLYITMKNN